MNLPIRAITFDLDDTLWPFAPIGERIETALRALPERTRQIFLLNRIHGCKYGEIAKAMQLSQSTVEKHMMRALEACKASVAEPATFTRRPGSARR